MRDLAAEYGTPVLVTDEADVRSRAREYAEAFGPDAHVAYAGKAFCSRAVLRWVADEGLGRGRLHRRRAGGGALGRLRPGADHAARQQQVAAEIEQAVAAGVGHIVVDSFEEIARLAVPRGPGAASGRGSWSASRPASRRTPTSSSPPRTTTRSSASRSRRRRRRGGPAGAGAALARVRRAALAHRVADLRHRRLRGGRPAGARAGRADPRRARRRHRELNLGGGFGIAYTPEDDAPESRRTSTPDCARSSTAQCAAFGLPEPRLSVEPGRGDRRAVHASRCTRSARSRTWTGIGAPT